MSSGELLHTLEGHTIDVLSVVVDPTGTYIVSGGNDSLMKVILLLF